MEAPIIPSSYAVVEPETKVPSVNTTAVAGDSPPGQEATAPGLHVPTVDIGPWLADPEGATAQEIVATVRAACESHGFFQITGHGIPKELQEAVFAGAKQFFQLPFEEKKALDAKTTVGHRGYDVLASQSYVDGVAPDLKEGFYTGPEMAPEHERVQARRFFAGANVWPASLPAEVMREPAQQYHTALTALTVRVLQLVAATLPFGPHIFDDFVGNDPITPMRVLHYPPARDTAADGRPQFGASAHTDFGAITLLLQDESPGLEVQDPATGDWVEVPPNTDAYVVNVGDMLSAWTSGRYVSSVHRVLNKNPWDRYSIVYFFDGNPDTELRALDGSEKDKLGVPTVEQHMLRRMAESYGKGQQEKKD